SWWRCCARSYSAEPASPPRSADDHTAQPAFQRGILANVVGRKPTETTARELATIQLATSDLVGVALRSVEDLEVSLPQFRLLRVLDELGAASATRCAQVLGVGGSSITRLVDRLDASGHLVRRPDAGNRSAVV